MRTSELSLSQPGRRSITTKYTPRPKPVSFPSNLPPALLSQIPGRIQPNRSTLLPTLLYMCLSNCVAEPKKFKIYPPPPTATVKCKDPVATVSENQLAALDPTGERRALFDYRRSRRSVKVGDIIRVTFKNGDPFAGVCLSIRLRGVDTACLLRNAFTKVGVEMWVKVFSPNVEGVEIVQRTEKRKRRARLYYMRCAWIVPVFMPTGLTCL